MYVFVDRISALSPEVSDFREHKRAPAVFSPESIPDSSIIVSMLVEEEEKEASLSDSEDLAQEETQRADLSLTRQ